MNNEFIIKKCPKCGAVIRVIEGMDRDFLCCGEKMITMQANTSDGAVEKHKPEVTVEDGKVKVVVNHVMDDAHYIEWIAISVPNEREKVVKLKPGEKAEVEFCYIPGSTIYAYCNLHGLWKTDVV